MIANLFRNYLTTFSETKIAVLLFILKNKPLSSDAGTVLAYQNLFD